MEDDGLPKRILGSKKEVVKKITSEEFHNLCSLPIVVEMLTLFLLSPTIELPAKDCELRRSPNSNSHHICIM
jgi:hypothetical protein